jgi:hypothetical protein
LRDKIAVPEFQTAMNRRASSGKSLGSNSAQMPKRTKKLHVYLDQNFLSEMSKVDTHERVRPEFKDVYELLHQGFINEKLVVPRSWLHDVESSLATHLKDRIASYQAYLGQVRLYRPDEIRNSQISAAFERFTGRAAPDPLRPEAAFLDHPDQKVERFGISVDAHLERHNFRDGRHRTAADLEALRQRLLQSKVACEAQVKVEQQTQRQEFLTTYSRFCGPPSEDKLRELTPFTQSADFTNIPLLNIEARLFAAILTRYADRKIKPSDGTDIDVLSAYAPYMDVVCTDAFMAEQLRSLRIAEEYGVTVFHAKTSSLRALKAFLETYLDGTAPVRRPSITVFVVPPKFGRDGSFEFFGKLGAALRAMGMNEYGEIYAFDDGAMPSYESSQLPGRPVPFYGLQDVTKLELPQGISHEEILVLCRERCRSDHFVLINDYRAIPETFMLGAAMSAESGMETTHGYRIYRTRA